MLFLVEQDAHGLKAPQLVMKPREADAGQLQPMCGPNPRLLYRIIYKEQCALNEH